MMSLVLSFRTRQTYAYVNALGLLLCCPVIAKTNRKPSNASRVLNKSRVPARGWGVQVILSFSTSRVSNTR